LTLTLPKPLVEFCNKPMILHQIEALVKIGVTDIVLAVNYRPEIMVKFLERYEQEFGIKITFSVESEPLGTAGPLALARDILSKDDSPFFVLNSDVICNFPFQTLLEFHKNHGKEGTIVATKVDEPSKYGVIVTKQNSSTIERFVEKPKEFVGNRINAGIYLLNPKALDRIELRPTSIEKEVFPMMAESQELQMFDLEGYWMDVGQPKDYLTGTCLHLSSLNRTAPETLCKEPFVHQGNVLIDKSAKVGQGCKIGPNVAIGPNVVIGDGVRLQRCVILAGTKIGNFSWIRNAIVGWNSTIGRWTRMEGISVLGDDVQVRDEVYMNGGCILPHKSISESVPEPRIIM